MEIMKSSKEIANIIDKHSKNKPCSIYEFVYRLAAKGFKTDHIVIIINELYRDKNKYEI